MTNPGVDELDTKDVREEEDRLVLGVVDGGCCDVSLDAVDDLFFACDKSWVRSTYEYGILMAYPRGYPRDERLPESVVIRSDMAHR